MNFISIGPFQVTLRGRPDTCDRCTLPSGLHVGANRMCPVCKLCGRRLSDHGHGGTCPVASDREAL